MAMAETVLRAAGDLPHRGRVRRRRGAGLGRGAGGRGDLDARASGLNGAVEAGVAHLARRGADRVIVAHADLPLATDLAWLADTDGVTLVPDRHRDGTNVLCVPAGAGFALAYGAGQLPRPPRRGRPARPGRCGSCPTPRLGWDVDVPADLARAGRPRPAAPTWRRRSPCR